MKKLLYNSIILVVCCLFFYNCKTTQQHITQKQYVPINIIDSAFEKLDINDARLVAAKKRYGTTLPIEYTTSITDTLTNGDIIITYGYIDRYYDKWITPYKGWFKIKKEYYANGNINYKRMFNKTSRESSGKMYEFDKEGNLIKTTDFDEGWQTPFETITELATHYAKKYNYNIDASINGVITEDHNYQNWMDTFVRIWREEKGDKKYWLIGLNKGHYENPDNKKCERVVVLIDDATGKVIKKKHYYDAYNRIFKTADNLLGLREKYYVPNAM